MEVLQRTANRGSVSTGPYEIGNSCKFEEDNSEFLWKTFSGEGTGTGKTFTVSAWVKRTELGGIDIIMGVGRDVGGDANDGAIRFNSDQFQFVNFASNAYNVRTNAVFRDTSAWYHIMVAVDTTQGTDSNRVKLYVNGVLQTSLTGTAYPTQNYQFKWGRAEEHMVGARPDSDATAGEPQASQFWSGYMADVYFVDGLQLAPTDFGEADEDSGIWKPINASPTFGNNGFYLDFADASDLGDDESGNGNDFTEVNIAAADQATDTPTNNGCTLNVLASLEGSNDITEGALVSTGKAGGGGNFNGTYGTMGIDPFNSSVDWYWEIETSIGTSGSDTDIGIGWIKESRITSGSTAYNNVYADGISRYSSQTANAAGDIWGVLLETGTTPVFKLYRNDSLIHTSTHGSGGVSFDTLMFPYITVKGTSVDARLNFLNPASSFSIASGNADPNGYGNFEFDPKGGYALCTKNLAEYG